MEKIKVLLAEDEMALATIIKESLETRNFIVTIARDGEMALDLSTTQKFDVLVLDVMMPKKNGFEVLKEVRIWNKETPVIFLTSNAQTSDVVYGFKSGANDYLKKPFSMEELIVRIENLIYRLGQNLSSNVYKIGQYQFDLNKQSLRNNEESHGLTFMESKLLFLLIDEKENIVKRSTILIKVWGQDTFFNGRSLDVFITKLRKKLASDPNIKIINVRSHGYKITY